MHLSLENDDVHNDVRDHYFLFITWIFIINYSDGGQNLERRNVERSRFPNFKIAYNKMTKDELFDSSIIEFILFFFYKLFE